jgi:hypothetical protein
VTLLLALASLVLLGLGFATLQVRGLRRALTELDDARVALRSTSRRWSDTDEPAE